MPKVTITRTDGGTGPLRLGNGFRLQATLDSGTASAWRWERDGHQVAGATTSELAKDASADTVGSYTAIATVAGADVRSDPLRLELAAPASPGQVGTGDATPQEPPPEFHPRFAAISAIVVLVVTGVILWAPASSVADVTKADWKGSDGRTGLAASVAVPLTVLGGAAVALGAWMALTEWRGRFKRKEPERADEADVRARGVDVDPGKLVEAIGKLRGAALVMVIGAALMLGSAWIAASSAEPPPAQTTTTTTSN